MLALAIRLVDLGREPFSPCEEGFNVILAGRPAGEIVEGCLRSNQNPWPIFLQKAWRTLAPATTEGDRLLFALLGAAGAATTYVFAARESGRTGGGVAALLVAASASAVLHARLAREYALLILIGALACEAWFRHRRAGRFESGAALAFLLALGLHTHAAFGGAFAALLSLAALDPAPRAALRRAALPFGAALILYAPWPAALALREGNPVWHLYRSTGSYLEERRDGSPLAAPAWLFAARDRPAGLDGAALLAGLLVAALLLRAAAQPGRTRRLALAALAPVAISALVFGALARDDLARARYLLPALPLLSAALAAGSLRGGLRPPHLPLEGHGPSRPPMLPALSLRIRGERGRDTWGLWSVTPAGVRGGAPTGLALAAALAALSLLQVARLRDGDEEPRVVAAGAAAVAALARPGDLVVVEPPLIADLYVARPAPFPVRTLRQRDEVGAFTDQLVFSRVESAEALLSAAESASGVVYWFYPYFDERELGNSFEAALGKRFERESRHAAGEGHVSRFVRIPAP